MAQYVVVDLEMCRISSAEKRKEFGYFEELIQIGAVLLNEDMEITDSYMAYVKPEFGSIDPFIENLTGIHPADVENAPTADKALELFLNWIPEDAYIVSWSESDRDQICSELDGKWIDLPDWDRYLDDWIDCQKTFSDKMNNPYRSYKLSEALNLAAIEYDEGAHDALVDARNTALLFAKMEKDDEPLLSPYLSGQGQEDTAYHPFSALLKDFKWDE